MEEMTGAAAVQIPALLAEEFHLPRQRVEAAIELIDQGNTLPFIARYRKEATGSMDDQLLRQLWERLAYLRGLEQRRQEVLAALGQLELPAQTLDRLRGELAQAQTLAQVEDLYRPYRPKRRTRASAAREKGLEPLADILRRQPEDVTPQQAAAPFVQPEKGVESVEQALQGAQDILAEELADDPKIRQFLRRELSSRCRIVTSFTKEYAQEADPGDSSQAGSGAAGREAGAGFDSTGSTGSMGGMGSMGSMGGTGNAGKAGKDGNASDTGNATNTGNVDKAGKADHLGKTGNASNAGSSAGGKKSPKGLPGRDGAQVYAQYAQFQEPLRTLPGHRILAIDRGEKEGVLRVGLELDNPSALTDAIERSIPVRPGPWGELVSGCVQDSYRRLLFPSLERELRSELTQRACEQAVRLFGVNLKNLLMQPPVRGRVVLGLDPGYRTGCKAAVVDATGRVLDTAVLYPTPPHSRTREAQQILTDLIRRHGVEVIAIGNGTASRETELFVAQTLRQLQQQEDRVSPEARRGEEAAFPAYMVVSEAGASVYSASKLAAEEFPEYDVSLRSAVSIARRLQDPLAELVKIDPKSIGVGQYQHDMPPSQLDQALGGVVEDCVNAVGVDLNTASESLLGYVAGIHRTLAKNIVQYREEQGKFTSRSQLLQVPKLGKKAFEQCAGFLRVPESSQLLDHTGVHPESYPAAQRLLELYACQTGEGSQEGPHRPAAGPYSQGAEAAGRAGDGCLSPERSFAEKLSGLGAWADSRGLAQLARELGVGEPTLRDMIQELMKPGRDPRDSLPPPLLRTDVMGLEDLKVGMVLEGTVRNVLDFGAFVDIGVHEDGLVHISQLSGRFVRHPSQVVKVGDIVRVRVIGVDLKRKRISLSMKETGPGQEPSGK